MRITRTAAGKLWSARRYETSPVAGLVTSRRRVLRVAFKARSVRFRHAKKPKQNTGGRKRRSLASRLRVVFPSHACRVTMARIGALCARPRCCGAHLSSSASGDAQAASVLVRVHFLRKQPHLCLSLSISRYMCVYASLGEGIKRTQSPGSYYYPSSQRFACAHGKIGLYWIGYVICSA